MPRRPFARALAEIGGALAKLGRNGHATVSSHHPRPAPRPRSPAPAVTSDANLGKGERRILAAVAQHADGVTRQQLTILTGYKRSSRDTYLQRLRGSGLVKDQGAQLTATEAGVAALGPDFELLPMGEELRRYWLERLPAGERRVLEPIIDAFPDAVRRDELDLPYQRSSRDTYLQRLSARRLVETPGPGLVRAAEELF